MQHLAADELEAYVLGRVKEPELAGIEEHLLVCAECQDRVGREDQLIAAIWAALTRAVAREQAEPAFGSRRSPEDAQHTPVD